MLSAYVFCLVVGGGLAALSAFGDLFGADAVDGDLDLDAAPDADLDTGADADGGGHAAAVFSLRSLIFTMFGFGGVGAITSWLGSDPAAPLTIGLAATGGLTTGVAVGAFLGYLKRSDTGPRATERRFIGMPARVTLPLGPGSAGRIVVRRGDREHAIRALPHPGETSSEPGQWTEVVVIEMRDGVAYVGPVTPDDREFLP